MLGFFTTPRIALGPGAVQQLSALDAHRVLAVLDPNVAGTPAAVRAIEELRKMDGAVETVSVPPGEPTVASVEGLVPSVRSSSPDWVVGIGGGSALDTAKALWVRASHPDLAWDAITPLTPLAPRHRCRFAAVPTTAGSGSEASWVLHRRGDAGAFLEVASRELVPDWAVVDPSFLATLPAKMAAETAADALAHALEAAVSEWANPFSDAHARAALSVGLPGLARLGRRPDDDLRESLLYASTQAGIAASNAQVGLVHALAHAISTEFPVPHARLIAPLLPPWSSSTSRRRGTASRPWARRWGRRWSRTGSRSRGRSGPPRRRPASRRTSGRPECPPPPWRRSSISSSGGRSGCPAWHPTPGSPPPRRRPGSCGPRRPAAPWISRPPPFRPSPTAAASGAGTPPDWRPRG